jgi:hypothetical protein
MREKVITGKARGFKKGDFVMTPGFPGVIISDVQTFAPCCEVWGLEHEMGSAYASELILLTKEEFLQATKLYGYNPADLNPYSDVSKAALA